MTERLLSISAGLEASTVTPGSTAPEGSLTIPARLLCAEAAPGSKTKHAVITTAEIRKFLKWTIAIPSSDCSRTAMKRHTFPNAGFSSGRGRTLSQLFRGSQVRVYMRADLNAG